MIDFKVKLIKNKSSKKGFVSLNKENSKKKKETNLTLKKDSSKISVSGNKLEKKSIRNSTCRWSSIQTP